MTKQELLQILADLPDHAEITLLVDDVVQPLQTVTSYGAYEATGEHGTEFVVLSCR